jgi:hypothetical protein
MAKVKNWLCRFFESIGKILCEIYQFFKNLSINCVTRKNKVDPAGSNVSVNFHNAQLKITHITQSQPKTKLFIPIEPDFSGDESADNYFKKEALYVKESFISSTKNNVLNYGIKYIMWEQKFTNEK